MIMNNALEEKLIKFGYAGKFSDLVYNAGSEDGLAWYWDNFLEKIVSNSKGFYSGAFIRYMIKSEAKMKYTEHLISLHEEKLKEAKITLQKITEEIKTQKSELSLNEWLTKYNLDNNSKTIKQDLELFIKETCYFDFCNPPKKEKKLEEFISEGLYQSPYAGLFRKFITEHKNSSKNEVLP